MISGTRYNLTLEINRQIRLANDIARGQAQVSSEKRIMTASDDPVGAARVAALGRSQSDQDAWLTNLKGAAALAGSADGILSSVKTAMDRAGELMLRASTGTLSIENRQAIALELQSIVEEVATLRDTRDSRGNLVFPAAADIVSIPVGDSISIAATGTREGVFDTIATSSGTADLLGILGNAVTAVQGGNAAAIQSALADTNAATSHVIARHGEQGARGARIDSLLDRNQSDTLALKEERSGIEDADITEILSKIQAQQLSLDAAQAVFARINKSTLFDLIS